MPKPILLTMKRITGQKGNLHLLYFLGFLISVTGALPAYINSNFFGQFVSVSTVGWFFMAANAATVFLILFFPRLIKRFKNYYIFCAVLALYFASLLAIALAKSALVVFLDFLVMSACSNLVLINMDIFVESLSANAETGRTRAFYFTCLNLGWLVSPFLSGYIVGHGGYAWVFSAAAALLLPFALIFLVKGRDLKDKAHYKDLKIKAVARQFLFDRNLRGIYLCSFLLNFFYSGAVVFIPIYLFKTIGFSWETLGVLFSIMLLPFILFEIPAGIIADKYWGEKGLLSVGVLLLAVSLICFGVVTSVSVIVWGALLFLSRTGAALTESMREAYFFKLVDVEDVDYINFFRTSNPMGYVAGSALGAALLIFMKMPNFFVFCGLFVFVIGFLAIYPLKDTK
jgi:MFS family permease